jgi:hypothetical protein
MGVESERKLIYFIEERGEGRGGEGAFREKNGPCRRWHLF